MSLETALRDVRKLSTEQRWLLLDEIWDSLAEERAAVPLSAAQRDELDRRIELYPVDSKEGVLWEDLKARLEKL